MLAHMTSTSKGKRYGRSHEAHQLRASLIGNQKSCRVGIHLWPDAYALFIADAERQGLTLSGMGHHIIRSYYQLPPLP
jgi:hypothetical protein